MGSMSLGDEHYIAVTTFRRNGTPVSTPVCVVPLGENEIGFYTASDSGKAKRLAHTPRVVVQASDWRGEPKPGSSPIEGTARIDRGADHARLMRLVTAKYPIETRLSRFVFTLLQLLKRKPRTVADSGVIVTLEPETLS